VFVMSYIGLSFVVLLKAQHIVAKIVEAVPWLRRLVAGLPARRTRFDPGSIHVGLVVDKVALGQVFPPEYFGFPLSVSFHRCSITHLHHRVAQ
jgi:hypothetical protein